MLCIALIQIKIYKVIESSGKILKEIVGEIIWICHRFQVICYVDIALYYCDHLKVIPW
jgi:hypothetical protein